MVSLPVVPQHVSSIFKDVTFAVLGQTGYKLDKGSTDMDQAREEGWLDEGIVVSDANSVYQFIKKHGGRYKISADIDCTLVLGGSHRDPKVETYIRAIEYAQSQAQGKKGKTKKALELEKIAQCKGVVRWTFVYSVVCRWLASGRTKEESVAMMEPERLTPSVLDYVASPFNSKEGFPRGNINLSNVDLSHLSSMRRALALYEESQKQNPNRQGDQVLNWRKNCNERLDVDKRWVVACDHQTLWPYKQKCQQLPLIQLYPDIFQAASGTLSKAQLPNEEMDDRWTNVSRDLRSSYISSVLPLARVMGAVVVSRLHDSVTHVLCDLREGIDEVVFDCNVKSDLFSDCEQGSCILGKLRDLQAERLQKPSAVLIISPQWIRKRKWRD